MKYPLLAILIILILGGVGFLYRQKIVPFFSRYAEPEIVESFRITENPIVTLKAGESKVFQGLTITNNGGGHKILSHGRGDQSFAELTIASGGQKENLRILHPLSPSESEVIWNNYVFYIKEVGWNGEFVTIEIKKGDDGLPFKFPELPFRYGWEEVTGDQMKLQKFWEEPGREYVGNLSKLDTEQYRKVMERFRKFIEEELELNGWTGNGIAADGMNKTMVGYKKTIERKEHNVIVYLEENGFDLEKEECAGNCSATWTIFYAENNAPPQTTSDLKTELEAVYKKLYEAAKAGNIKSANEVFGGMNNGKTLAEMPYSQAKDILDYISDFWYPLEKTKYIRLVQENNNTAYYVMTADEDGYLQVIVVKFIKMNGKWAYLKDRGTIIRRASNDLLSNQDIDEILKSAIDFFSKNP